MTIKNNKILRSKALELLTSKANHLFLIIAFIISIAFATMIMLSVLLLEGIIRDDVLLKVVVVLECVLAAPLLAGLRRMAVMVYKNKEFGMSEMFFAFSSVKNYLRVLAACLVKIVILAVPYSVERLSSILVCYAFGLSNVTGAVPILIVVASTLVSAILILPLYCRYYAVGYYVFGEGKGVFEAIIASWQVTKGKIIRLSWIEVRSFPILVASLVVLALPYMLFVFPYRLCFSTVVCGEMEKARALESENNENMCSVASASDVEDINEQDS